MKLHPKTHLFMLTLASSIFSASCYAENAQITSLQFSPVSLAQNNAEKSVMRVSPKLTLTFSDNSKKDYPLSYKILAKMGDKIGHGTIGLITDINGKMIKKADGSVDISDGPDGNSLIKVGDKYFLITHMEERPGELYKTELKLLNNEIKAVDTAPVDLKTIGGTIINCASTKTNYGSHLGGEEDYSLNSRAADMASPFYQKCTLDGNGTNAKGETSSFCAYVDGLAKYLNDGKIDSKNGYSGESFSLYNYGKIVEVQPQADGSTKVAKHHVTGRYTPELAAMMPDNKTVYMSDDGTFKGFWKFVSDKKIEGFTKDWEGTLYAAKVKQTSAENGGAFDLSWVQLGHAKDSEIQAMIDAKPKLTDIFKITQSKDKSCPADYKAIHEDSKIECLKLIAGKEKQAAFLETRKYAAYLGATIEFRKEEGITYNPDKNVLYIAMSEIKKSMEKNYKGMEASGDDIQLPKNACGGVYEVTLNDQFSGTKMHALVVGKPLKKGEKYADEWYCHPDEIANPDNMTYIGHDTLLISEDTTKHVNNMTWAYNTKTNQKTRIASLPIGAEVTGVDTGSVGNKPLLIINAQHPFKDNPKNAEGKKPNSALLEAATEDQLKAFIGYIDGLPTGIFK